MGINNLTKKIVCSNHLQSNSDLVQPTKYLPYLQKKSVHHKLAKVRGGKVCSL